MRNTSAHPLNAGSHTPPAAPILQTRPSTVVPSPVQRLPSRSNARPFVPGTPDAICAAGPLASAVASGVPGTNGLAFDRDGNRWTVAGTTGLGGLRSVGAAHGG